MYLWCRGLWCMGWQKLPSTGGKWYGCGMWLWSSHSLCHLAGEKLCSACGTLLIIHCSSESVIQCTMQIEYSNGFTPFNMSNISGFKSHALTSRRHFHFSHYSHNLFFHFTPGFQPQSSNWTSSNNTCTHWGILHWCYTLHHSPYHHHHHLPWREVSCDMTLTK